MRLILTHEQADLDAIASLLGAHLVDPEALALLPRNINRNAAEFVRAHLEELGFSQYYSLPKEPITHVTLVDTQSLITLKGMTADTLVNVIDHHPRKEGVSDNWSVEISRTGACTEQPRRPASHHNDISLLHLLPLPFLSPCQASFTLGLVFRKSVKQ